MARRLGTALLCVVGLVGCGGGGGESRPSVAAEPGTLAAAADRVHEAGTFAFTAAYSRELPDREPETSVKLEGAVDVVRGSGRMSVELASLFAGTSEAATFDEPVELRWTSQEVRAALPGEVAQTLARARARESAGLLGRLPDEPAALVELLRHAEDVEALGTADVDGRATSHLAFSVDARRAGAAGVPVELSKAFREALHGPRLALEAWIDADGLPRRIAYAVPLPEQRASGRVVLPARTVRGTYDLRGFGDAVE